MIKTFTDYQVQISESNLHAALVHPPTSSHPVAIRALKLHLTVDGALLFVAFYNQLSVYLLTGKDFERQKLVREHVIGDFDEELMVISLLQTDTDLYYAYGGKMACIYVSSMKHKAEVTVYGHFKPISDLQMIQLNSTWLLMMSASEDFSVRIWLVNSNLA